MLECFIRVILNPWLYFRLWLRGVTPMDMVRATKEINRRIDEINRRRRRQLE